MSSHPRDSSSKPSCWSDFLKVCIDHLFLLAFATHVSPSLALNIYLSLPTQYVSSLWLLEPRWCWRAPTMWQVSLSTPSGAYRNSLLCQLFCDPSPFLHRLRNFIKFLLSCCKWLGLSTTHGQKNDTLDFQNLLYGHNFCHCANKWSSNLLCLNLLWPPLPKLSLL